MRAAARPLVLYAAALALLGCSDVVASSAYTCLEYDKGHLDAFGNPDPCHRGEPPDAGVDAAPDKCPACLPYGPADFYQIPVLLWLGPKGQAPAACPKGSTHSAEGYMDLDAPGCGCTCEPSTGVCNIPSTLTAYSAPCQNPPQGQATAVNAPANWGGSCNSANPVQAGALCGGVPCVQSLSSEPIVVTEDKCVAIPQQLGAPQYKTEALVCIGEAHPGCEGDDAGKFCAPSLPGFRPCIYRQGTDQACPAPYPTPYVLYREEKPDDQRWCTPCDCGTPMNSMCTAALSVYQDSACTVPVFTNTSIASTGLGCTNIMPPGLALGSKEITNITYHPGTCTPNGGETMGSIDRLGPPYTYCCRDPEVPK